VEAKKLPGTVEADEAVSRLGNPCVVLTLGIRACRII
jgi:hypothetical protein